MSTSASHLFQSPGPAPWMEPDLVSDAEEEARFAEWRNGSGDNLASWCPKCSKPAEYPSCETCGFDLTGEAEADPVAAPQAGMLEAALAYGAQGIPVFPCGPDKKPLVPHGFKNASNSEQAIRAWWGIWPDAMIGRPTGAASGVVVLDVDNGPGKVGGESLAGLIAQHGPLPDTWEALTPSGGRHLYFTYDPDRPIPCSASRIGQHLDIRGDGGYVVVPPSQLPDGRAYEWELSSHPDDVPLAPVPEWLRELAGTRATQQDMALGGFESHVTPSQLADLQSALVYLDPRDYGTWIKVGHALRTIQGSDGWDLWRGWSRGDLHVERPDIAGQARQKWGDQSEGQNHKRWMGFTPNNTGYQAVFSAAAQNGWENPAKGAAVEATPSPDEEGSMGQEDLERLISRSWRTGTGLPPANATGLFEEKNRNTGKVFDKYRVQVIPGYTAPWIKIAWDAGTPERFLESVEAYLSKRTDRVDRQNLERMDRGQEPQPDIPEEELRAHAQRWLARVRNLRVTDEMGEELLGRVSPPWPDLVPLGSRVLPRLSADHLSGWAGAYAGALAVATETPCELALALVLAACSTACARRLSVVVAPGYREPTNLWVAASLPPGNRKSAVQKAACAPLVAWEREAAEQARPEIARQKSEAKTLQARADAARKAASVAKDADAVRTATEEAVRLESLIGEEQKAPQLWTSEATPERLGTMLAEQNECMAWLSSEAGLFDLLAGRYSKGVPNLDLVLKAWSGDPERVDRMSRPPVYLASPRLTIGLSPQPDLLRGLANQPGFRGRGLLGRFLYLLPESPLGFRDLGSERLGATIPHSVDFAYQAGIRAMLEWVPDIDQDGNEQPHLLHLEPAAYAEWLAFARAVEVGMRPGGEWEQITDLAGKMPGAAARIAGVLHGVLHAHGRPWEVSISVDTMDKALGIAAVMLRHGDAVMDLMGADKTIAEARRVWDWLERGRRTTATVREAYQALKGTFPRVEGIEKAIEVLEERGYVRSLDRPASGPGRPASPLIEIRPDILGGWA